MKDISMRKMAQQQALYLYNKSKNPFVISFSVNSTSKSITLRLNDYVDITNATDVIINTEGYTRSVSKIYFPENSIQKSGDIKESWNLISGSYKYIEVTEDFFNYPSKHGAVVYDAPSAPSVRLTPIGHASGTNLTDDSGNKYKINSKFSFDYTAAGSGKTTTVTTQNLPPANWNRAAKIINALRPASAADGSTNVAPPTAGGTIAPAAPAAATPAAATPAAAAPAAAIDPAKVKGGLVILLKAVANGLYKINPGGIRAETKVWKGVIDGFGGADKLAEHIMNQDQFTDEDKVEIQNIKSGSIPDYSNRKFLGTINSIIYTIKNNSKRRFLGIDLRGEGQIAKSVKKKMTAASSLHELHTLSKVAARREKAKKMLNSAVEKENSDK